MADTPEVNQEIEVIGNDAVDSGGGDDEQVVPALDEGELNEALQDAANKGATDTVNTPSDSSTDDSSDDDQNASSTDEPVVHSKKPVDGETVREKALRLEITRLKQERRMAAQERIAGMAKPPSQEVVDERFEKLKGTYSDDEIRNMEEAIDVIASRRGYVKKADSYQESVNLVLEAFIDSHKEYKPENDKDDLRWNRFQEVLMADYNLQNKTPKQIANILFKVHRDLAMEDYGDVKAPERVNKLNAQQQKIRSVSHAGGNSAPQSKSGNKLSMDESTRKMFKDFSDEDLM